MIIEAFGQLLANSAKVNLLLVEWGAEIERTKKLWLELTNSVKWLLPSSKPLLRKHMRNSLVVLDQFELEAFWDNHSGSVSFFCSGHNKGK